MALFRNIQDLARALPAGTTLLGLDVGKKTIGLAGSDPTGTVATPLATIERTRLARDLARIEALARERGAGALVLGWPVNMDGTEGPRCQAVLALARDLEQALGLPILLWDERWSTQAVERAMIMGDLSRAKRAKAVDRLAAAYILQGALEALRAAPRPEPG